jgi:hypothetical protein
MIEFAAALQSATPPSCAFVAAVYDRRLPWGSAVTHRRYSYGQIKIDAR